MKKANTARKPPRLYFLEAYMYNDVANRKPIVRYIRNSMFANFKPVMDVAMSAKMKREGH